MNASLIFSKAATGDSLFTPKVYSDPNGANLANPGTKSVTGLNIFPSLRVMGSLTNTARFLNFPARMNSICSWRPLPATSTSPCKQARTPGAPPLYGICRILILASVMRSSFPSFQMPPTPELDMVYFSGSLRAASKKSARVLKGESARTAQACSPLAHL